MSDDAYTINVKGLDSIIRALKKKPPVTRVGILGSDAARSSTSGGLTNDEIGRAHEYGSFARGLPERSFLRMPVTEKLEIAMENSGALKETTIDKIIKAGSVIPWMQKVAVLAHNIVLGAFDSGGYGKWPKWKNENYQSKTGKILMDTTQLRNSITYEVKE